MHCYIQVMEAYLIFLDRSDFKALRRLFLLLPVFRGIPEISLISNGELQIFGVFLDRSVVLDFLPDGNASYVLCDTYILLL